MRYFQLILVSISLLVVSTVAYGGSTQHRGPSKFSSEELVYFSKKVERYAASEGAYVFLISRLGKPQEELPNDVKFTHVAIAVYSEIETADGEILNGYAIYNLYQDYVELDTSKVVMDYPVDFFSGVQELKSGILIPIMELQLKLMALFESGAHHSLHTPAYSLVSNPFDSRFQNCTEYVLDLINAAIYETTDKAVLKANAQAYFDPYVLNRSRFMAGIGSLFNKEYSTKDQGRRIEMSTYSSIEQYLLKYDLVQTSTIIELGDSEV